MNECPKCDRCHFYAHSTYLVCALHPSGPERETCLDFRQTNQPVQPEDDPLSWYDVEESWQPDGAAFYNGELILQPEQRLSLAERWALLDWHPLFTGRCPECERSLPYERSRVHWDCEGCGWKDDSV
ncbi:hypothetical protein [Sphaerothrix gracilis]|uniref:hypothetical protein n=1 Tax=Sphaerothrix gracilis TaxID=3151835 RepID=UPI0031FDC7EE